MAANDTAHSTAEGPAERVVVSFRAPETDPNEDNGWNIADSDWLQEKLTEQTYVRYLQKVHSGPVSVGDEWEEFVNCGCASPQDVILRVESVDGGTAIGSETTIDLVSRKVVVQAE